MTLQLRIETQLRGNERGEGRPPTVTENQIEELNGGARLLVELVVDQFVGKGRGWSVGGRWSELDDRLLKLTVRVVD